MNGPGVEEVRCRVCARTQGHEHYRVREMMFDPRLRTSVAVRCLFAAHELRGFDRRARELNRMAHGDQATFYLRRL